MRKPNWEILSLTRFFLAAIVMVGHSEEFTNTQPLHFFARLGSFEAVLGFLLISGYSIGKSIQKERKGYFARRLKRIYPVYIASIAFQIVAAYFQGGVPSIWFIIINIIFLNQIITSASLVAPAWTLQTEVGLYISAPLLLKATKKTLVWLTFISFILYVSYTCGRSLFQWNYFSSTKYGINIFLLAFIWVAGFLFALYPSKQNAIIILILFLGHVGATSGIQFLHRIKHHETGLIIPEDLIVYLSETLCLLIVWLLVTTNERFTIKNTWLKKSFNLAGNISYPLYLTHETVFHLLAYWNINNFLILAVTSLIIAVIFYYLFDFYSRRKHGA